MPSSTGLDFSSIDVVSPTIEAVTLNAISGILAQAFTAYKAKVISTRNLEKHQETALTVPQDLFAVDLAQILQFMLFTAIVAAPNYIFQTVLEKCFPTRTVPKSLLEQAHAKDKKNDQDLLRKHGQLDVRNTVIKFFLDQSLSATTNTMLFIVVLGLIKGQSIEYIRAAISTDFWPMLLAGYRFWPIICLLNLVMVPMEYRPLVGNGAGLVWGIIMSLW